MAKSSIGSFEAYTEPEATDKQGANLGYHCLISGMHKGTSNQKRNRIQLSDQI